MNSPVDKIKERLSIEEVVSTYIKLDRTGMNLKAKCPFHNEKTPSFFVSPERGSYYCFGCRASGDIFTFVEEFEGLDFKGALRLLAGRAGVMLREYTKEDQKVESEKERLYEAMEEATSFFENNLKQNEEVLKYLKTRGLTEKSMKDFRLGYIAPDWRLLFNYLKTKNFTDQEIERAGLAKTPDQEAGKPSKALYDRFRGRIMFPIADSSGRIVAFSGRIFIDDGKSAKYLNSPDTPIFSKSAILYGLDKAKDSIRKNNFSILVEGQMDLVLSHQAGYKNTIATSGTALSDSIISKENIKENIVTNLGLVRRLSPNIVLAFDADKAGFNASNRAGRIALSLGMDVKVAKLPDMVDPADLISKQGIDAWREAIRNSKHIIEFLLDKILRDYGEDARKAGRLVKENILPYVDALGSSIEKMHFIKKISDLSGISQNALQDDLKKIEQEFKYGKKEIPARNASPASNASRSDSGWHSDAGGEEAERSWATLYRKDYIERKLLGIALWKGDKELLKLLGQAQEKYKDSTSDLIFEAEVFYGDSENLEKDIKEMLENLEVENINEELLLKMQELRMIKNKDKEMKLLVEIQELNKQKHEKKNKTKK